MQYVLLLSSDQQLAEQLQPFCPEQWQLKSYTSVAAYLGQHESEAEEDLLIMDQAMLQDLTMAEIRNLTLLLPMAVRIMLVPDCQDEIVLQYLQQFHSFSSRQLSGTGFRALLQRVQALQWLTFDPALRRQLFSLQDLPLVPKIASEVKSMLDDPDADIDALSRIIEQDTTLTSRLLQLANSPYMGFSKDTSSVSVAISRMGLNLLYGLVVALTLEPEATSRCSAERGQQILAQSLQQARLARKFCALAGGDHEQQEEVVICSMFTGFGHLVLECNGYPSRQWHEAAPDEEPEARLVAAFILTLWGFSNRFTDPLMATQLQDLPEQGSLVADSLLLAAWLPQTGANILGQRLWTQLQKSSYWSMWAQACTLVVSD